MKIGSAQTSKHGSNGGRIIGSFRESWRVDPLLDANFRAADDRRDGENQNKTTRGILSSGRRDIQLEARGGSKTARHVPGLGVRLLSFLAMANQKHLDILVKGVEAWNEWRREYAMVGPALPEGMTDDAILSDLPRTTQGQILADLILFAIHRPRLDLRGARLSGKNLSGADLSDTDLTGGDLTRTDLGGANLKGSDLSHAALDGAVLTRATLMDTLLLGTKLANADMDGVLLYNTTFNDVDLSATKNLSTVRTAGPCSIGLDTIYRSGGKIPESFLRGAGVPENFITFMKSLTGAALEFYSVFISYSTKDQAFADRLYADLQSRCVRCWFAPHDIQGGRKLHEQIEGAIRDYDKLLLILSEASMNSPWVKTEIANARSRENEQNRQMLFPITLVPFDRIKEWKLFDADRGVDSAREIREYFIPDFSNWKNHDSYRNGFERLLIDLKSGAQEKANG